MSGTIAATQPPGARVELGDACTIYQAEADRLRVLDAVRSGGAAEIDLSRVKRIDTAGVQILVMAHREALGRGTTLTFPGISPEVLQVLDCFGLGHIASGARPASGRDP